MLWSWNAKAGRYTVTSEGASILGRRAGTFVSVDALTGQRQAFIDSQKVRGQSLVTQLLNEDIDIGQWVLGMREQVKQAHLAQYMLGAGGKNAMTQADYGRVGNALRDQYGFLNNFAEDILSGDLSEKQIRARANLYFNSSNAAFERGRASSISGGTLTLPEYPADGSTVCKSNCKCRWVIEDEGSEWLCYWRVGPVEHCADCIENSNIWNPLIVSK